MSRILCLCEGGNVRSGALATLLKDRGHDALQAGVLWNSADTIALLSQWADVIYIAEERLAETVPEEYRRKLDMTFCVGPDRWGIHMPDELAAIYLVKMREVSYGHGPRQLGNGPFVKLKDEN